MEIQIIKTDSRNEIIAGKVNPGVKEKFRELARRKGLNVSRYLNSLILRELEAEGITFEVRRKIPIL